MTKEVAPSRTTHQNTTSQPNVIKLKALRICVIIVTDTPRRMAINKNIPARTPTKISCLKAHRLDSYQATNERADRQECSVPKYIFIEAQRSMDIDTLPGSQNAEPVE